MGLKKCFIKKMLDSWDERDRKAFEGRPLPDGVCAAADIPYIDDGVDGHMLDVYFPENASSRLPVVLDVHGGGFMSGNKELNKLFGYHLAKRGFVVFNINYRLGLTGTMVTGQLHDVAAAAKWIYENAAHYPADTNHTFIAGHSAGAVHAVMEAMFSRSERLRSIFGIDGGYLDYKGIALDCGMMTFYENTLGYRGMRSMCFEKGYKDKPYYQNMIWDKLPELDQLPPVYLISNENDELKNMTLAFERMLEQRDVYHKLNFAKAGSGKALGHMAILYHPEDAVCSGIIDEMIDFLTAGPAERVSTRFCISDNEKEI